MTSKIMICNGKIIHEIKKMNITKKQKTKKIREKICAEPILNDVKMIGNHSSYDIFRFYIKVLMVQNHDPVRKI